MSDQHRPRFVVPAQGGQSFRPFRRRDCDAEGPDADLATGGHGEERFQALFEHLPAGVALSRLDGRFSDANPGLRDLLEGTGVDPDRDGLQDLVRHLPPEADQAQAWRRALADVGAGRAPVARAEISVALPGGSTRWVQVTTALVEFGGRRFLLSHLEDTTERRAVVRSQQPPTRRELPAAPAGRDLPEERLSTTSTRQTGVGWPTATFQAGAGTPEVPEVDLRETDLRETDLREADLREADLREADLRETDPDDGGTDGEAPLVERPA